MGGVYQIACGHWRFAAVALVVLSVPSGGGCAHPKTFARRDTAATSKVEAAPDAPAWSVATLAGHPVSAEDLEVPTDRIPYLPSCAADVLGGASDTGRVIPTGALLADLPDAAVYDGAPELAAHVAARSPCRCQGFRAELGSLRHRIWTDHANYYSCSTAWDLFCGVALGALFANTSWDQDIRDWYQEDVRSRDSDNFASFWKTFGEGEIFIGAFAGLAVAGKLLEDRPIGRVTGDFGGRVTRSYLVGAPPVLFMQAFLGGSRPQEDPRYDSRWKPFDDNNAVSGHAFIGSVPFITAAMMSEGPLVKGGFYVLSALPAWSRVNDDAHYFSQACLGWWMGYLACRAVDNTEQQGRQFAVMPVTMPGMVGVQAVVRR